MDTFTAVLGANLLTVMFVYGGVQYSKKEKQGEFSWIYWICLAFPIGMFLLGMAATEPLPPSLDALSAQ